MNQLKNMTFSLVVAESEYNLRKIDKNCEEIIKEIKHRIRFVDNNRLLTASRDTCVNNLSGLFVKIIKQLNYHTMILILFQNVKLV